MQIFSTSELRYKQVNITERNKNNQYESDNEWKNSCMRMSKFIDMIESSFPGNIL